MTFGWRPRAMPREALFGAVALLCILVGHGSPALAQTAGAVEPSAQEGGSPPQFENLEAFLDGFMDAYLAEGPVAGGVVAIVQGGELVLARGYGYDDMEVRRPVDPERTLFRLGSVSKLFVWTAVMQLVESGQLDLDADVNQFLEGFELPATFDTPVTMASLMSHTGGFEDRTLGLFSRSSDLPAPLGAILARDFPARVRPPGQFASYSNHGAALAMHVVELVSGQPWKEYLAEHVFQPLTMARTTFEQPVGPSLGSDLAKGYGVVGGELEEAGFEVVPLAPTGGASATATDMARFMVAHLQLGEFGEARILREETSRRMHSELFRHADGVNPMAYGFVDGSRNGERMIGHGGDTVLFHSLLQILPERKLGIFVAFNTAGANPAKLIDAFMDRYFPVLPPPPISPRDGWEERLSLLVGSYRSNRFSHSDLTKLPRQRRVEVTKAGDGALSVSSSGGARWLEVEPLLFREEHGARTLAFRQEGTTRATHMFVGDLPMIAFERPPLREGMRLHRALASVSIVLFVGTLVLLPLGSFLRWRFRAPVDRDRRIPLPARALVWTSSLIFTIFFFGMALELQDSVQLAFGVTTRMRLLLLLPTVGGLVAAGSFFSLLRLWRRQQGRLGPRFAYTLVVLSSLTFLWQLAIWQLLSFPGVRP